MHHRKINLICLYFVSIVTTVITDCVEDPCNIGEYCAPDGILSANPNDCSTYFQCIHGTWKEELCSASLLFNPESCLCDYEYNVACLVCPTKPPPTIQRPGPCEPVPEPCPAGERYADRSSCEYFYECQADGSLSRVRCETPMDQCGTSGYTCLYDIHCEECLHPYAGFECDFRCFVYTTDYITVTDEQYTDPSISTDETSVRTTDLETDPPTTNEPTPRLTTETERPTTQGATTDSTARTTRYQHTTAVPLPCAEDPCNLSEYCHQANMRAGNPNDCTSYYQCLYGTWSQLSCDEGMAFNPTQCYCDGEYNVDCLTCPSTTPRPTPDPGTCPGVPDPCPTAGERYADVSDCEYFYECQPDGTVVRQICEAIKDECTIDEYACIFDIYESICMYPYEDFDCHERCADGSHKNGKGPAQKFEPLQDASNQNNLKESVKTNTKDIKVAKWKKMVARKQVNIRGRKRMKSKVKSAAAVFKLFGSLLKS